MAVLILAKHDNDALNDATAKTVTAAKAMGGDITVLVAGQDCAAVAEAAATLDGVAKVIHVEGEAYGHRLAEPLTELVPRHGRRLRAHRLPGDHLGQERRAAARGAARRDGDLRHHRRRRPRHLRAADLRRQRHPDRAVVRPEEGRHRARRQLRGRPARRRPAPIETARGRRRPRRSRPGSRTRSRPPTGRSSPRRASSSPAAAASARRRTSRSSRASPTSSAPRSAPRRAAVDSRLRPERLAGRPDRQGGRRPTSTSPSASPARSSTSPA